MIILPLTEVFGWLTQTCFFTFAMSKLFSFALQNPILQKFFLNIFVQVNIPFLTAFGAIGLNIDLLMLVFGVELKKENKIKLGDRLNTFSFKCRMCSFR